MDENNSGNLIDRHEFSERFRRVLYEKGMLQCSYANLAQKFNVTSKALRRWLDGTAMPKPTRMFMISYYLGVNIEWLVMGKGECYSYPGYRVESSNEEYVFLSANESRMLLLFRSLPSVQQQAMAKLIGSMIKKHY